MSYIFGPVPSRRPRTLLSREELDVLCPQETKVQDKDFPVEPFRKAGYHVVLRPYLSSEVRDIQQGRTNLGAMVQPGQSRFGGASTACVLYFRKGGGNPCYTGTTAGS